MTKIKRVLVVEDDPGIQDVLVTSLTDEGYSTMASSTGKEALELLRYEEFSIITLDMRLPDMTGNDLLNLLPLSASTIPVVVVSANEAMLKPHSQVKSVVPKPFDIDRLLTVIASLI